MMVDKPPVLRVRGPLVLGNRVGIVGTRKASGDAKQFAADLAEELSCAGVTIWSGGAEGIDAAAHEGGLRGRGGTVVVMPSGLSRPYPEENDGRFDRVLASGSTIISGFEDHEEARRGRFFRRNAILVACVPALVVVQCGFQSGARNAAGAARTFSRKVGVVPNSPWEKHGGGWREEARLGAKLVYGSRDVFEMLELPAPPSRQVSLFQEDVLAGLPVLERRIAGAIRDGARHVDAVCDALGEPVAPITRALLALVLRGTVIEGQNGLALASSPPSRHPGVPP
jgi:DNA processing protein